MRHLFGVYIGIADRHVPQIISLPQNPCLLYMQTKLFNIKTEIQILAGKQPPYMY